jgi:hypothetical protein
MKIRKQIDQNFFAQLFLADKTSSSSTGGAVVLSSRAAAAAGGADGWMKNKQG